MPARRSRAVERVRDWLSLASGTVLLFHEFYIVPAKDWTPQRVPLVMVAAGLLTLSFLRPGGLWDALIGRAKGGGGK